jgi:hypothetical protein
VRNWIWQQISIDLPEDWELLQFSRNPAAGRCAFADRYQFRLELDWRTVQGPPDFNRMLSDYSARLGEMGMEDAKRVQRSGWQGVTGREKDRVTARYGQYFPRINRLIEIVFLWPRAQNPDLENTVLSTTRPAPATVQNQARWRAFGMDLLVGADFEFDYCAAEPANAYMLFLGERKRVLDRFSRRGMLSEWLHMPLQEWLATTVPKHYAVAQTRTVAAQGHDTARVTAVRRRPVLRDLLFGRREFQAACWICPEDERLYCLSREAPRLRSRSRKRPSPALACCSKMEATL